MNWEKKNRSTCRTEAILAYETHFTEKVDKFLEEVVTENQLVQLTKTSNTDRTRKINHATTYQYNNETRENQGHNNEPGKHEAGSITGR